MTWKVAVLCGAILLAIILASLSPIGIDFGQVFYPAWRAALMGGDPYAIPHFYNPPWLLLLYPLAALPMRWAWAVFLVANPVILAIAFRRMGLDWFGVLLISFSPLALYNAYYGNIDSIVLLGATLPPQYGIWLLLLKPQMGVWLVGLWAWRAFKQDGIRGVVRLVAPVALAFVVTFLAGAYRLPDVAVMTWSADVWPFGLVAGLPLLYLAWRKNSDRIALAAAPFLSPYVAIHSWTTVLLLFAANKRRLIAAVMVSWGIVIYLVMTGRLT